MNQISISVLVPTYNRRDMLCEALEQILVYDDPAVHEIIVSENHSNDSSLEEMSQRFGTHPKIKIIQPQKHCGPLSNWKNCLDHATGSHLHWHWSDDKLCAPFYNLAASLAQQLQTGLIMGPVRMWYEDGFRPVFYSQLDRREMYAKQALRHLFMDGTLPYSPAAYILPTEPARKHFYEQLPVVGDLDPNQIAMGADALMVAGCILETGKIGFLDVPIMDLRSHAESISVKNTSVFKNYHLAFEFFQCKHQLDLLTSDERRSIYGQSIYDYFHPSESSSIDKGEKITGLPVLGKFLTVSTGIFR